MLSTETMYCRGALLTNQPTKGRSSQVNQYASMKSSRLYLTALGLAGITRELSEIAYVVLGFSK